MAKCRKRMKYKTLQEANIAMGLARLRRRKDDQESRVYYCKEHQAYHFTSEPKKER